MGRYRDRLVFIDADTAALLPEHRRAQLRARMAAGSDWHDDDLVFCQPDGPWNQDHVSRRFKRLAVQAGLPQVKLHEGGRHTGNNHPLRQAHLAAAAQVAGLVDKAGP